MVPHNETKFVLASLLMLLVTVSGGIADTVSYSLPTSVQQRVDYRPATVSHDAADLYDNDTSPLKIADGERWAICGAWTATSNSLYFHVVFALLFFAFLAPANNFGMIWLRAAVVCASLVMFYSAWFLECDQEKFIWAALIFFVNFIYLTISLIKLRPVKFDKEIECVYVSLFEPLHVSRLRFKKILQCMKTVRVLKYQEVYAQEKVTKVDSLSLVLTGKLVVSQNQKALHIVFPHQFLDSPEWFGVSTDDFFQVSIVAMEESRVLLWHRDKLKLSIMGDPFLQTVIDHILGRDVVKKLMQVTQTNGAAYDGHQTNIRNPNSRKFPKYSQVNETMAQSNGFIISEVDEEDKPMLITNNHIMGNHHNGKTNGKNENNLSSSSSSSSSSSPGITALINRQLQAADVNAWRLGRIEETDHETPV